LSAARFVFEPLHTYSQTMLIRTTRQCDCSILVALDFLPQQEIAEDITEHLRNTVPSGEHHDQLLALATYVLFDATTVTGARDW